MVLVDSSVWIDHLKTPDLRLGKALLDEDVLVHPWVLGELCLHDVRRRRELLRELGCHSQAPVIAEALVLKLIEEKKLSDSGVGWVGCQLMASAFAMEANLWTHDMALKRAWEKVRRA